MRDAIAYFVVMTDPPSASTWRLYSSDPQRSYLIGRDPDLDIVVGAVDGSPISRKHAEIVVRGRESFLTDLNSTNGTELNGRQLVPGRRNVLEDGAEISFAGGFISALFQIEQENNTVRIGHSERKILGGGQRNNQSTVSRGLLLITNERRIVIDGIPQPDLSDQEWNLLSCLYERAGTTCTYGQLLKAVWSQSYGYSNNNIAALVRRIRSRLTTGNWSLINIRNVGYRLEPFIISSDANHDPPDV